MADIMAEVEELKKKLAANPDSMIFVPLADAFRKAGMHKEAIDTCKSGLEKHPTYTSARVVLGRIYSEKEMLDEAIEELKKVEAVDVDNIMVHSMLGNAYLKKLMYPNAVEQFQRVLSLNPDDTETQEKLREALSAKQTSGPAPQPVPVQPVQAADPQPSPLSQKQESKTDVQKSLKVAELYVKKEEFEKAIEVYREILDLDSENIIVQQRLREVYDLQEKKHRKQQQAAAADKKSRDIDTDKITAEDILDVMKNAVENDSVDEPAQAKSSEPAAAKPQEKPAPTEEPKATEPVKEEPKAEPVKAAEAPKAETKKEEPPKKEEPEPPAKETVAKAEEIDDNKKKQLQEILKGMSEVDGIVGSFYLLRTGKIVASVLPPKINAGEIESLIASIVEKTEMSVKNMNQGRLNQVVIASESGQLLFTEISKGVLFMIGDANINVGKMGLTLKSTIEKMKKVL